MSADYEKDIVHYWLQQDSARMGPWKNAVEGVEEVERLLLQRHSDAVVGVPGDHIRAAVIAALTVTPKTSAAVSLALEYTSRKKPLFPRSLDTPLSLPTIEREVPIPEGLDLFVADKTIHSNMQLPCSPLKWVSHQCLSVGIRINPRIESTPAILGLVYEVLGGIAETVGAKRVRDDTEEFVPSKRCKVESVEENKVEVAVNEQIVNYVADAAAQSNVSLLGYLRTPMQGRRYGVVHDYAKVGPAGKTIEGACSRCFVRIAVEGGFVHAPPSMVALSTAEKNVLSKTKYLTLKRGERSKIARLATALAMSKIRIKRMVLETSSEGLAAFSLAVNQVFPDTLVYHRDEGGGEFMVCVCGLGCERVMSWLEEGGAPLAVELPPNPPALWPGIVDFIRRKYAVHNTRVWCTTAAGQMGNAARTPIWCITEGGALPPNVSAALERSVVQQHRLVLPYCGLLFLCEVNEADPHKRYAVRAAALNATQNMGIFRAPHILAPIHRVGDVVRVTRPGHPPHTATVYAVNNVNMTVRGDSPGERAYEVHVHDAVTVARRGWVTIPAVPAAELARLASVRIEGLAQEFFEFRLFRLPPDDDGITSLVLELETQPSGKSSVVHRLVLMGNGELWVCFMGLDVEEFAYQFATGPGLLEGLSRLRHICDQAAVLHNLSVIPKELTMTTEELLTFPSPTRLHANSWVAAAGPATQRRQVLSEVVALWDSPTAVLRVSPHATLVFRHHLEAIKQRTSIAVLDCTPAGIVTAIGSPENIAKLRNAIQDISTQCSRAYQEDRGKRLRDEVLTDIEHVDVNLPLPQHVRKVLGSEVGVPPEFDPPMGGQRSFVEELNIVASSLVMLLATPVQTVQGEGNATEHLLLEGIVGGGGNVTVGAAVSGVIPVVGDTVSFVPTELRRPMQKREGADPVPPLLASGVVTRVDGISCDVCDSNGKPIDTFLATDLHTETATETNPRWHGTIQSVYLDAANPRVHRYVLEWLRSVFYGPRLLLRPILACVKVALSDQSVDILFPQKGQFRVDSEAQRSGGAKEVLGVFLHDYCLCVTVVAALRRYPSDLSIVGPAALSYCVAVAEDAERRAQNLAQQSTPHEATLYGHCCRKIDHVVSSVRKLMQIPDQKNGDEAFLSGPERLGELLTNLCEMCGALASINLDAGVVRLSGCEEDVRTAINFAMTFLAHPRWGTVVRRTVRLPAFDNEAISLRLVSEDLALSHLSRASPQTLAVEGTQAQCDAARLLLLGQPYTLPTSPPSEHICCACLFSTSDDDEEEGLHTLLCQHVVHPSCLRAYQSAQQERRGVSVPMCCPAVCEHILTLSEYENILGVKGCLEHLEARIEMCMVERGDAVRCAGCGEWLACSETFSGALHCHHCDRRMCSNISGPCGGRPHEGACDAFSDAEGEMLARRGLPGREVGGSGVEEGAVACRNCPALIVREDEEAACDYMRCRQCGYEFCWLCLRPANDHRHIDPHHPTATPACDPEQRKHRIATHHTQPRFSLSLNKRWLACTRCAVSLAACDAYECLQCLNMWLCVSCEAESAGCPEDPNHVLTSMTLHQMPCPLGDTLEKGCAYIGAATPKLPDVLPSCGVCHRQAFGEVMQCTRHGCLVCMACAVAADAVILRQVEERVEVVRGTWVYSTLERVRVDGPVLAGQTQYLKVPYGWEIAEDSLEVRKVVQAHLWSCAKIVVASGRAFATKGSGTAGALHRALAGSAPQGYRPNSLLPAPSQILVCQPIAGPCVPVSSIPSLSPEPFPSQPKPFQDECSLAMRLMFQMPFQQ